MACHRFLRAGAVLAALAGAVPVVARAQAPDSAQASDTLVFTVDPLVVTATRTPRALSRTPRPVSVVGRVEVRELAPNSVSDLFRALPGVEITGVGVNQGRPAIRGQRGQRILLLEDGLRLNNSRRQQDFGELPALVDVTGVERVEIVRGPASVLYGSDAIGGVVNIITRAPEREGLHGLASFRYGSVEEQARGTARAYGRFGRLSLQAGGTLRNADPYEAPAGSFGAITLDDEVVVHNTGVQDRSGDLRVGWDLTPTQHLFGKVEAYTAEESGFGSVDPGAYAPDQPTIDITYPDQRWAKLTLGYRAERIDAPIADRFELLAYGQDNERDLVLSLFQGFGPQAPPGAGIAIVNENTTDIRTYGLRAEARKAVLRGLTLTYGMDVVRDDAQGTDVGTSTLTGFGPPQVEVTTRPQIPEASFLSLGGFLQGEVDLGDRLTLIGGGRYQRVHAETYETEGLEGPLVSETDGTAVAALNALFTVTDGVALVASAGRAFRSPNLIERFFDGPTPEGSGYQVRNPDLEPETSFDIDLGVRVRRGPVGVEVFGFRNKIYDGIRVAPTGEEIDGFPAYTNVNVDELVYRGIEVASDVRLGAGFMVAGSYTHMDSEDALDPDNPVGDSFSSKVTGTLRWDAPGRRVWAQWDVRHNGERKDVELSENPVGEVLPAFTVQDLRGGVRLFATDRMVHRINVALTNLTDELYAEASNASFFRPEPKRNLTLTYEVSF
jgi:hemoglobin/transferrin/lactoferrin receptor protein